MDELLNCSCGTAPKLDNMHQWFFVQCPKCHARTNYFLEPELAVTEWNKP